MLLDMTKDPLPKVMMETTQGSFTITLFPAKAPKAVENFLKLAETGYYNDVIFHRVIKNFMIQGGDPTGTGRGGESAFGKSFPDECHKDLTFDRPGLLAMANRGPNTNGSQFFITTAETPWLNGNHTIFGEVTGGYEVIKKIETTKTDSGDKPLEQQKIVKITVSK